MKKKLHWDRDVGIERNRNTKRDMTSQDMNSVFSALQEDWQSFKFVHDTLKMDREFVLACLKMDGRIIQYTDESLKKDRDVILTATKLCWYAIQYADDLLRDDLEFVEDCINTNREVLRMFPSLCRLPEYKRPGPIQTGILLRKMQYPFDLPEDVVIRIVQCM